MYVVGELSSPPAYLTSSAVKELDINLKNGKVKLSEDKKKLLDLFPMIRLENPTEYLH